MLVCMYKIGDGDVWLAGTSLCSPIPAQGPITDYMSNQDKGRVYWYQRLGCAGGATEGAAGSRTGISVQSFAESLVGAGERTVENEQFPAGTWRLRGFLSLTFRSLQDGKISGWLLTAKRCDSSRRASSQAGRIDDDSPLRWRFDSNRKARGGVTTEQRVETQEICRRKANRTEQTLKKKKRKSKQTWKCEHRSH